MQTCCELFVEINVSDVKLNVSLLNVAIHYQNLGHIHATFLVAAVGYTL